MVHGLHDAVTGLPDDRRFSAELAASLARYDDDHRPFAIMRVDVSRVPAGQTPDEGISSEFVLQVVAHRIRHNLAREDFVARLPGMEFGVILRDISTPNQLASVSRRLLERVHEPVGAEHGTLTLDVRLGVARFPGAQPNAAEMMREAAPSMSD